MIGPYGDRLTNHLHCARVVPSLECDDPEQVQRVGMPRFEFQRALEGLPRWFKLSLLELP
jgi:hypothetical protein